jgi:hypothetical protein
VQPSPGNGAPTAAEPTIPASDVGESAIPSADPPRTSDQP